MDRHISKLAMLLAAQLLLVIGAVLWQSRATDDTAGALFDFDRNTVDGITITNGDGDVVVLEKSDTGWRLPDANGLPADLDKVTTLLDKLTDAYGSWPVATSAASAKRFEVAEDGFQRRVEVRAGGASVVDLYTGTSPGFRKVHARRAGDDDVFAVTFANYEAPALSDEWLDKTLLQVEGEFTAISGTDWRLELADDAWRLDVLAEGEATDLERSRDIANKLGGLRVTGVAGNVAWIDDAQPRLTLSVTTADGEVSYSFYRQGDEGDFVVKRSGFDAAFSVAAYSAESLLMTRDELVTGEVVAVSADEVPAAEGG